MDWLNKLSSDNIFFILTIIGIFLIFIPYVFSEGSIENNKSDSFSLSCSEIWETSAYLQKGNIFHILVDRQEYNIPTEFNLSDSHRTIITTSINNQEIFNFVVPQDDFYQIKIGNKKCITGKAVILLSTAIEKDKKNTDSLQNIGIMLTSFSAAYVIPFIKEKFPPIYNTIVKRTGQT